MTDFIKSNVGSVCLIIDTWTSDTQSIYMRLTAHFIDNEWNLRNKVLSFCRQEGHRGVDIGKTIETCLKEWGIENVFTISVDNATSNDVAIDFFKRVFQNSSKCLLNAKWIHIRCVGHIVNLVVQDGIKLVNKSIDKIKWAVKWIRNSPLRIEKFNRIAKLVDVGTTKQLISDVPTRWNSTYLMLDVAKGYQKTFERYDLEESDFKSELEKAEHEEIKDNDWQNVKDLCHFLKPFYEITLRVSTIYTITSNSCIDEIYSIRDVLDNAISSPGLCKIAMAMNAKFDKYFGSIEKMNMLLYFALVLDPRNKTYYLDLLFKHRYGEKNADEKSKIVMLAMHELFDEYIRIHSKGSSTFESSNSLVTGNRKEPEENTSILQLRNKLRENVETHRVEPVGELEKLLKESYEKDYANFNLLKWWKVNSPRFPILSLMARDLFVILVSTVASESVFSTSGRVLDAYRNSMTPKIVESLICTQDWLRNYSTSKMDLISEEDWEMIHKIDKEIEMEEQKQT